MARPLPGPGGPGAADGPVLVALSGGVDSAVAAVLLREQGFEIAGVTLKTFCYGDLPGGPKSCCGLEGVEAARAVAGRLGIPHLVLDVSEQFRIEVIDDFVREYAAGRTPNPCVVCNATVKIPYLLDHARRLGYRALATGHYARVLPAPEGGWALHRGLDGAKDQAYFLWQIPRPVLAGLRLPLGGLTKAEVRALAERAGLANARRPESQEICFIPDGEYIGFLRRMLPADHPGFQPGPLVDARGNQVGTHTGYLGYTVGQRRGLGGGHGRRLFVIGLDPARHVVRVGEESDLLGRSLCLDPVNCLAGKPLPPDEGGCSTAAPIPPTEDLGEPCPRPRIEPIGSCAESRREEAGQWPHGDGFATHPVGPPPAASVLPAGEPVLVQIRHRARPVPGRLLAAPVIGPWKVALDQPARAITPGQSAVLFQGDRVIAGGRIASWKA